LTKDRSINIFLLDYNVTQCAKYHCDKHVVKMPLESTQMLSTVHWRYENEGPYLPCTSKAPLYVMGRTNSRKLHLAMETRHCIVQGVYLQV